MQRSDRDISRLVERSTAPPGRRRALGRSLASPNPRPPLSVGKPCEFLSPRRRTRASASHEKTAVPYRSRHSRIAVSTKGDTSARSGREEKFARPGPKVARLLLLCAASGYALSPAREAAFRLLSSKSSIELQHIIDAVRRRRHVGRRADTRVRPAPHSGPVSGRLDERPRRVRGIHRRAWPLGRPPATRWGPSTSRTRPHANASVRRSVMCCIS
jgi:hypothetical protein